MQKYELDDYITVRTYPKQSHLTIFIFGAWGMPFIAYAPLLHRLRKQGLTCILFIPSRKLVAVGVPYSKIVGSSTKIVAKIKRIIAEELSKNSSAQFTALGISLGTAIALKATKECPEIKRVALVAAHGDFSRHVPLWHDKQLVNKLLKFDKIVESQPTSMAGAGDVLNSIHQTQNFQQLTDKAIYISYGSKDMIMHTEATKAFVEELQKANISIKVRVLQGGHWTTMAKSAFLKCDSLKFLLHN